MMIMAFMLIPPMKSSPMNKIIIILALMVLLPQLSAVVCAEDSSFPTVPEDIHTTWEQIDPPIKLVDYACDEELRFRVGYYHGYVVVDWPDEGMLRLRRLGGETIGEGYVDTPGGKYTVHANADLGWKMAVFFARNGDQWKTVWCRMPEQ